ncbi:Pyridoxal 5'-phosphate synthase subunit snz1 [Saitozyma podzolica]|uniref:pyridoxal 5'-phosphate synthase (glutamine hydrolyzing) n=1 Tax=Saitozyma podzolica TaxID=1890683 RepID=A0A427XV98_9TREE|nr:Pyridoxal 5'-phosphate synthase subunit snz1 [Saitozyma podzolica]
MSTEPTVVPSSTALPATANGGTSTPVMFRGAGGAGGGSGAGGTFGVKTGLAQMLKGGVIMDVMNVEQAKIAEEAGAAAVMALERIPANIRRDGGVARMSDPGMIKQIMDAVSIPVMAKVRIGHTVEAQILQSVGVDYIDESEVLTMADDQHHIGKHAFKVPFVCGCKNLGEALRRISEGAAPQSLRTAPSLFDRCHPNNRPSTLHSSAPPFDASLRHGYVPISPPYIRVPMASPLSMIRTKGEAGTGDVVEAVRHQRAVMSDIRRAAAMSDEELYAFAKELSAPYHLLKETARLKRLPVVSFAAGGVATPADAALMMQLGCDGVFVGSGIFLSGDPAKRARAIVQAVTHYNNPAVLAEVSTDIGEAMVGISVASEGDKIQGGRLAGRGN